jgi:hypothetical protein
VSGFPHQNSTALDTRARCSGQLEDKAAWAVAAELLAAKQVGSLGDPARDVKRRAS